MQVVTFVPMGTMEQRIGLLHDGKVVDTNATYAKLLKDRDSESRPIAAAEALLPADILSFLDAGDKAVARMKMALAYFSELANMGKIDDKDPANRRLYYEMNQVRLKAPIPRPRALGIGWWNTRGIIEESRRDSTPVGRRETDPIKEGIKVEFAYPKEAAICWGHPGCVIGPEDAIVQPRISETIFNGIELGIVVGKEAYQVPLEKANDYIFGYTVTSDITAFDLIQQESLLFTITRCKDMPTFWPLGPCITYRDEIPDPRNLNVIVRVNGKEAMSDNTRSYIFSPFDYIHDVSKYMVLEPGTVIAMGSFAETTFTFIKPGDIVENEIQKIGVLTNRVVAE